METENQRRQPQKNVSGRPAKVLVVDDHPLMRIGLRSFFMTKPTLEVCDEAATAREALQKIASSMPDVVVLDISLPDGSGLDLVRDIHARFPSLPILVLSMHDEGIYAERVLRAGALGYVMKHDSPDSVVEGLHHVLQGEIFVSDRIANGFLSRYVNGSARKPNQIGVDRLTDRELQVFELIGQGQSTREIAGQLNLSVKTIETYRSNIKMKLGQSNVSGLMHAAIHWVEQEASLGRSPDAGS